jgi:hypothetical protein
VSQVALLFGVPDLQASWLVSGPPGEPEPWLLPNEPEYLDHIKED